MPTDKNGVKFRRINWTPVVVGKEPIKNFKNDIDTSVGWISDRNPTYPFDIIVALEQLVNIYKIKIGFSDDEYIPNKIDVQVGINSNSNAKRTYEDAKSANYVRKGTLEFVKRNRRDRTYEAKTLFVDAVGNFLWLIIHEPYENSGNPNNQIRIRELEVYGYLDEEITKDTPTNLDKDPPPHNPVPESSNKKKKTKKERSRTPPSPTRYSYDGDGLVSHGDVLSGDPLTSVRLIKSVLQKKREKAIEDDRVVEATVCLRAIERLDEYEERIVSLKSKMSTALQNNDTDYAERYRLAMIDCRDTVFRAIHLDLLIERRELRALGMESKWSS